MSNLAVARRFIDHWNETGEFPWDELDPDAVFVIDPRSFVLGETVLALGRIRARGAQSGATGTQSGAFAIQVRDGMVVSYRSYLRREEALEALGVQ
jgi:ketosteroid isomerase-like protein